MKVVFTEFDELFLEYSWFWLNDPAIKRLLQADDFTQEDQRKWFESLKNRNDYLIWGIKLDTEPIGSCGLKSISANECEYWGYIGEKNYWGKGIGKIIMAYVEEKAIEKNLSSIWLKVTEANVRAIGLYEKYGYIIEFKKNGMIKMRKVL